MSHQIVEIDREMNSMMTNGTILIRPTTNNISSNIETNNDEDVSLHMKALPTTSEPTEQTMVTGVPIRSNT